MKKILFFGILLFTATLMNAQRPIITKWNTNINNDNSSSILIYTEGIYNYTYVKVDDASINGSGTGGGGAPIHFPQKGIYIVSVFPVGSFKFNLGFAGTSNNNKFIELSQWGDVNWNSDLSQMFKVCLNLQITATDIPNFSNVTNMRNMFANCEALLTIPNMNSWNTSNVTDMTGMFGLARNFNQNIGNWDVSKVTEMGGMFMYAMKFNQNLENWKLNSNVNLENMFDYSAMYCENYSKTLYGWAENSNIPNGRTLGAAGKVYGAFAQTYRNKLINEKGWTILGDSFNADCNYMSVADIDKKEIAIYPNPVKEILNFSEEVTNVKITDLSGRTVKQFSAKGASVNVANLAKGVYMISGVTKSGEAVNRKIVKE